jgi:hypothetical protein
MKTSAKSKRCARKRSREDVNRARKRHGTKVPAHGTAKTGLRQTLPLAEAQFAADLFAGLPLPLGNRPARRRLAQRAAAPCSPSGRRLHRARPPAGAVPAKPPRRTTSHAAPAARPPAPGPARPRPYLPGRVLMNLGWLRVQRPPRREAAAFDKAADLRSALFGEAAERLAALGSNEGVDQ